MNKNKINKFLTQMMGESWHVVECVELRSDLKSQFKCYSCNVDFQEHEFEEHINIDFSTWEGLGRLMKYLNNKWHKEQLADIV